jgi:hypothetical protein
MAGTAPLLPICERKPIAIHLSRVATASLGAANLYQSLQARKPCSPAIGKKTVQDAVNDASGERGEEGLARASEKLAIQQQQIHEFYRRASLGSVPMDGPDHDALPAGFAQHLDDPVAVASQCAARRLALDKAVSGAGHRRLAVQA